MPSTDVLIFGEDYNDCAALSHLVKALLPANMKPNVRPMRRPIILSREAEQRKRAAMSHEIASFAHGFEKAGKKVTVVTHRDCDAVEPAHIEQAKQLKADLNAAGVKSVVAATPAWEIESWWMLFPKALRDTRPSWKNVDYGKAHVGAIVNAKERLTRDLRPNGHSKCPDFKESDGILIAQKIAKDASHIASISARSDSFSAFKSELVATVSK